MTALLQHPWSLLGGAYIVIGIFVVIWLTERIREKGTPRHQRLEHRFRLLRSDLILQAATAFPPLFLVLIAFWPVWALYIWTFDAEDDEPT